MIQCNLRLKEILLVVFAVFLIIISPLLQIMHLSSCTCEHSYCNINSNVAAPKFSTSITKRYLDSIPKHSKKKHPHDSENCPVCHMYASLHAGFSIPFTTPTLFSNITTEQSPEYCAYFYSEKPHCEYSPRAPPAI